MMPATSSPAVARSRDRIIVHREISSRYAPRPLAPEDRHAWEQSRLDQLLRRLLCEAAIERAGLNVSDDEIARDAAAREVSDERIAQTVATERQWLQAALAVYDGEAVHTAYARLHEQDAVTVRHGEECLAHLVTFFDSHAEIVESLERIDPSVTRHRILDALRFELGRRRLHAYFVREAAASGVTVEEFARRFWQEIITDTKTEVVDPRYRMISWREMQ